MSTDRKRVLISGASIAGPALAYWLHRYGYQTTIIERAPELRTGGQNVDVRGAGREVSRRMGIEDDIRAATTGEVGTRFIGRSGSVIAEFPAGTTDSGGATAGSRSCAVTWRNCWSAGPPTPPSTGSATASPASRTTTAAPATA